jgi:CheY-like chemotaxis protein
MGKKILLADDSITIQKVIELTFSDEDFEVVTVGNGRLAVERVQEVQPDLVLCDIIMPEKDGYEVCDFIKKNPALSHIPVLLLTGAFEPFDQERAARVGCDGFLAKPFEPQTLIAKVKDLLNQGAGARVAARPAAVAPPAPAPGFTAAAPLPAFVAPPPPAPPAPEPTFSRAAGGFGTTFEPAASTLPPATTEPEITFIPDEPLVEESPEIVAEQTEYEETAATVFDEPPLPPSYPPRRADPVPYVVEAAGDDDLMEVSAEESATLVEPVTERTLADEPTPWSQPTIEVPLETRAKASVESAHAPSEPVFEEVFEEERETPTRARAAYTPPAPPEPFVPPAAPPPPSLPVYSAPPPVPAPPIPVTAAPVEPPRPVQAAAPTVVEEEKPAPAVESSFGDLAPPPESVAVPASAAAEVAVPVDMVEKIAQRVVAQISEKVIREIAWEVIPDLAESLIKKEIDRLKAELQES